MNYLAHFYFANLSEGINKELNQDSEARIIGHYLGDFIKGKLENLNLDENLISGIVMHRELDKKADSKILELLQNGSIDFEQRRYAGITFDLSCDHFLAKHWQNYHHIEQKDFAKDQISLINRYQEQLPERALFVLDRMEHYRWLENYQDLGFLAQVFAGIERRFRRKNSISEAFLDLKNNYPLLEQQCLLYLEHLRREYSEATTDKV